MAMSAASVGLLMMVSLEALILLVVAAGSSVAADAAVVSGGGGTTIRLPSDAASRSAVAHVADDLVRAMATAAKQLGDDEKRPWECCDIPLCTRSIPPICRCLDPVDSCPDACKKCQTVGWTYICTDTYDGYPGPTCYEYGNGRGGLTGAGKAAATVPAAVMADGDKKKNAGGGEEAGGGDHDWARRLARGLRF